MKSQVLPFVAALSLSLALPTDTNLNVPDSAFTFFDMPTPNSGPCDVATGPDDLLYIQTLFTNQIVRFNQNTEEFTSFDIPFTVPFLPNTQLPIPGPLKAAILSCAIRVGYDGHMYFSNGARNQLVQHNTTSGETRVFTPPGLLQPIQNLQPLNDVTAGPQGVFFSQSTGNNIVRFDYETHEFKFYPVPTPGAVPFGMHYASDGAVWFLEFVGNKVGRFDPETETMEEFPLPLGQLAPVVVRAETANDDGSTTLWFAVSVSSAIVGINTVTKEFTVRSEPNAPTITAEVAQDQRNNVWATHLFQNTLGVLNPRSGRVSTVTDPGTLNLPGVSLPATGGSGIVGFSVGQAPGIGDPNAAGDNIWYTRFLANKLIRLDLTQVPEIP